MPGPKNTAAAQEIDFREQRDRHIQKEYGLKPKNDNQAIYMESIRKCTLTFGLGPAGTGKSYVAAGMSALGFGEDNKCKIILFRPNVETGQKLGHLPGDLDEKIGPYHEGLLDTLQEHLGAEKYKAMRESGQIQSKALGFQRGATFKNCYVILDEAQNTDPVTMKMFLTRIGENCKVIINGDMDQVDVKGKSGLQDAIERLKGVDDIAMVEFTDDDCVRSKLVKDILARYKTS